jgi:hypothetical protein
VLVNNGVGRDSVALLRCLAGCSCATTGGKHHGAHGKQEGGEEFLSHRLLSLSKCGVGEANLLYFFDTFYIRTLFSGLFIPDTL